MANKKIAFIFTIITSMVLFIITYMQYGNIFKLILPNIKNLNYQNTDIKNQFKQGLYFSIVVGLSPILLYLTWRLAPITNTKNRIFSALITLLLMIASIGIRHITIKSTYNQLSNLQTSAGEILPNMFPIDNLHFEYYIFGGLILSCALVFFIFKEKQ